MFKLADNNGYIDVIIYVLIMVGGLVVNAYRNYMKRKEMEKGTGPQPQSRPILPDILFEPVFEYETPQTEKEVVLIDEPLDDPVSAIDGIPEETVVEKSTIEGEAVFESTKEVMISEKIFEHESIEKDDLTTKFFPAQQMEDSEDSFEFDVREAIIYSEILKPRYF